MSEIDTRIDNLERELEALKAAREAEKSPPKFEIEGDVFVGQIFPARDGGTVTVTEILKATPRAAAGGEDFYGSRVHFRASHSGSGSWYYNETGLLFPKETRPIGADIIGQAIGVKPEVGGVYRRRDGHIAIVTKDLGDDGGTYRYRVQYMDDFEDDVTVEGVWLAGGRSHRDLVRKIGTVNLDA